MREGKNEESKNTINITMKEGKSAIWIYSCFIQHLHFWSGQNIEMLGLPQWLVQQKVWDRGCEPSSLSYELHLENNAGPTWEPSLRGPGATQLLLVPFTTPLSEYSSLQWKKYLMRKSLDTGIAGKDRNLSISGPQFRKWDLWHLMWYGGLKEDMST